MPDKYEREIEEILRKMSFSAPKPRRRSSGWSAGLATNWQNLLTDLSPGRLYAMGMALALLGYLARAFSLGLAAPLSLLALVCLIGGFVLSIRRRSAQRPTGWRGRTLDLSGTDFWADLRRRWDRWRREHGGNGPRRH